MPWEEIEKCCHLACTNAQPHDKEKIVKLQEQLGVPHSEDTLALLVHVHIIGGNKDLSQHLSGLTMRVTVVRE